MTETTPPAELRIELPPPSPALVMHQAAARLRDLADAAAADMASNSYWSCYDPATAWRDGLVNGFGGKTADLAAVFSPATARALADWLDSVATSLTASTHPGWQECVAPDALAVARQINGGES